MPFFFFFLLHLLPLLFPSTFSCYFPPSVNFSRSPPTFSSSFSSSSLHVFFVPCLPPFYFPASSVLFSSILLFLSLVFLLLSLLFLLPFPLSTFQPYLQLYLLFFQALPFLFLVLLFFLLLALFHHLFLHFIPCYFLFLFPASSLQSTRSSFPPPPPSTHSPLPLPPLPTRSPIPPPPPHPPPVTHRGPSFSSPHIFAAAGFSPHFNSRLV